MRGIISSARRSLTIVVFVFAVAAQVYSGPFEGALDAYGRGDFPLAVRLWRPLAEQGDAIAQFNLGVMYANSHGVTQDYAAAVKWYRLAAEQGVPEAESAIITLAAQGTAKPATLFRIKSVGGSTGT